MMTNQEADEVRQAVLDAGGRAELVQQGDDWMVEAVLDDGEDPICLDAYEAAMRVVRERG